MDEVYKVVFEEEKAPADEETFWKLILPYRRLSLENQDKINQRVQSLLEEQAKGQ